MKFISLILTIDNVINTNIFSENNRPKPQDVIDKQKYVDDTIDTHIRIGNILEQNRPKINVYYDMMSHKFECVPANVLTMHMRLTYKYDMRNLEYYEQFKHLIDTEPDFVNDVNRRHKMANRMAELRTRQTFPGLQYYIDVFGFPNYDPKDDFDILETLSFEFNINYKNNPKTFEGFKQALKSSTERIDYLYGITGGTFKVDSMWTNLFARTIKPKGIIHYYRQCNTKGFEELYFLYNLINLQSRLNLDEINNKHKYKAKSTPKVVTVDDNMKFMGLQVGFTYKQLKKRFRKLAIKYHPDKCGGDSQKFLQLKECYDTLLKGPHERK